MAFMDELHWPLTLLSRAINYKNLTHAAANIGISQPQLSRIISKLEAELKVSLLDRESKRKSSWTKEAHNLGELYQQYSNKLQKSIEAVIEKNYPKEIFIGTLEGLIGISSELCNELFHQTDIEIIHLNVFDLSELQDKFSRGELDVAFTSTLSGAKKQTRSLGLGYQTLNQEGDRNSAVFVVSPYEKAMSKIKSGSKKTLISNSLATRKLWLSSYDGKGQLPSKVLLKKTDSSIPVHLVVNEHLNVNLWNRIKAVHKKIKENFKV